MTKKEIKEIRKDPDNQDWNFISIYQNLSEEFIKEFKDRVNWKSHSFPQELSLSIIEEFEYLFYSERYMHLVY